MKKIRIFALMSILVLISADSFGGWFQDWRARRQQRQIERVVVPNPDPVGVPLDGGLLAILAAAGATYFGVKKKKNKGK